MIVADTSALLSIASGSALELFLDEFEVVVTETVLEELEEISSHEDRTGKNAEKVIAKKRSFQVHDIGEDAPISSRIDEGEGSSAVLARKLDADFLITDDPRALPELESLVGEEKVAISPVVLRALVKRGVLERSEALEILDRMGERRDWLSSKIYERARGLLEKR